jgi:hypothetical protein
MVIGARMQPVGVPGQIGRRLLMAVVIPLLGNVAPMQHQLIAQVAQIPGAAPPLGAGFAQPAAARSAVQQPRESVAGHRRRRR